MIHTIYKVTTELRTPWWKKLLRFLRIIKKREEFLLTFYGDYFKAREILDSGMKSYVKIVSKAKYIGGYDPIEQKQ